MAKTVYTKCPHLQANPEKFEDHPRDDSTQMIWKERVSNRHVFWGCHNCLKLQIEAEWAKTEIGRARIAHMQRVNLVEVKGSKMYAPEDLIKTVIEPLEMPNGEIVMMLGFRINNEYKVTYVAPEPETVPETPNPKPETPEPDATELRAFLEPVVAANEKFVALWKQGKTGPLIGAARKAATGKYEGKYIEKTLKEIAGDQP